MAKIYLVCGVPGSGKTYVCEKLRHKFEYIHHDGYIHLQNPQAYLMEILRKANNPDKPLLIEAPFSISRTKDPLEAAGHEVIPVFIIEDPQVLSTRYRNRENKQIPQQHLTRMNTFAQRAHDWKSFRGTSDEVLEYLSALPF